MTTQNTCALCAPESPSDLGAVRCPVCLEKGDLVGEVVWAHVADAVRAASPGERVTFMLVGLPAVFLEGIARTSPSTGIEGRSLLLRMNPSAARELRVAPAFVSHQSAVHWRHNAEADVIVFAPSDEERQGIGAGLGPLPRIDGQSIVAQREKWLDLLGESGEPNNYLRSMLDGLRASQIFIDLEMWVDFILAIREQDFRYPVNVRIQNAAPALRIPRDGITKLPAFKQGAKPKTRPQDFRSAFHLAHTEVGVYAGLMTPKQEPVDTQAVRAAVDSFEHQGEQEVVAALEAVRALLDDEQEIRPGAWHESQRNFCERVSWDHIGSSLFSEGRRTTRRTLGDQTLDFIEGNYGDDVTDEDRDLLRTLKDTIPREPRDEELEFFERWQDQLNHPHVIKVFRAWHRRLFSKEVIGHDLMSAFAEGFEALIIAGADKLADMEDPRVLVRTTQHNKAIFWERLDAGVQKLFRFQLQCLRGHLGPRVLWDLDACFHHHAVDAVSSNDGRKVDLELYLVEAGEAEDLGGLRTPHKSAPRVKATWQPGLKAKDEPISLAFPDDIEALATAVENRVGVFRRQSFAPRTSADESRVASTTLTETNSFNDVALAQDGRTFDVTVGPKDDILAELRQKIAALGASGSLPFASAETLRSAVDVFGSSYGRAIKAIAVDPGVGFTSEDVVAQAEAFGALCEACRVHATSERARMEIRPLVARIGILPSEGSDTMAIVTAWHPLRLAERRAKILDLAMFVDQVLGSPTARNADLTIAFEERRALTGRWVFPEVAMLDDTPLVSVEDVAGYSLLVPADCVARSQEALETSAPSAAEKFMEGVRQYLEIHPHESTNLAAAIYNSESQTLPLEISRQMAQLIHRDRDLRCDLVITHHDQERLRTIYRNQNLRLGTENISETAKGFLSRLRVDVKPNRTAPGQGDAIRDMDLVFLHDAISHHAKPSWVHERGSTEDLDSAFDLAALRKPRRRLTEADAPGVGVYLTLPRPPRAVAQYQDLLYEMGTGAVLPPDHHGVLIRHVQFDDSHVEVLIRRAHDLAEWVVTYDKVSCRRLLEMCKVQIIRDISAPGSDGRVIISAGTVDDRLKSKLKDELIESCGVDVQTAAKLAEVVLRHVLQISGQKVLSAARYANSTREMIGLSVMRAFLTGAVPSHLRNPAGPIWISLDDYRGWFSSGKGKVADAIGVTILDRGEGFELLLQVGEAKFVGMQSELAETKEALKQVRATMDRLARIFINNEDEISRAAWCTRLTNLLVDREGLSERISDPLRRAAFLEQMVAGDVCFRMSGEAVVCLHDFHATSARMERDVDFPHLRHLVLPTPLIRKTLHSIEERALPELDGLTDVRWYPEIPMSDAFLPEASQRGLVPACQDGEPQSISAHLDGEEPDAPELVEEVATNRSSVEYERTVVDELPEANLDKDPACTPETFAVQDGSASRFIPLPVYDILSGMASHEQGAIDDPASIEWVEQICRDTQRALSHFDMQAHFAEPKYRLTPNGALLTFRGHPSLTVDRIEKRQVQLLTTHGIEVVDVRPGRGRISLFVKREKRAKVPLASTWLGADWPNREPGEMMSFILGAREDDDKLLYLNLAGGFADYDEHAPHTLIAGETGSGKGVLTQGLLLQMVAFNDPGTAELILVDPKKGVDFGWLNGAPHMKQPIVTEIEAAASVFSNLVVEMDARYQLLVDHSVPHIGAYNRSVSPEQRLSRIFLVHDELGAWMAQEKEYQEVVLSSVSALGMKARAAGIHLFLITQRADADAVPTRLRDNMGNRLCLKVQNSTGSRMVLDRRGAEKLLGKGHLACVLANQATPPGQEFFVVQVPFAEFDDLQRLAAAAMEYWRGRT